MTVIGQIKGMDELADRLRALPDQVMQSDILAKGLLAGGDIIREAAQGNLAANGTVDTGLLKDTMMVKRLKEQVAGLVEVSVKPSTKLSMVVRKSRWGKGLVKARPSKYAHFIEYGTERQVAHPFMRPAYDEKRDQAVQTITTTVERGITAEMAKLGLK